MLVAGWDKKKGREGMPRFKTSLQTATLSSHLEQPGHKDSYHGCLLRVWCWCRGHWELKFGYRAASRKPKGPQSTSSAKGKVPMNRYEMIDSFSFCRWRLKPEFLSILGCDRF